MKTFDASLAWERGAQAFTDQRYSRAHSWQFDGGLSVPASSSPLSVPLPMSDPAAVDPEEALVASASSCHMLFFLSLAAARGLVVDRYRDSATGYLDADEQGRQAIVRIVLRPRIDFAGQQPAPGVLAQLHQEAHARCYIASSLRGDVVVEGAG
ncbi:OsmC family protein [Massilia aerilata]|uniref:OsmC family protein n=1 Tax=Massilia aerilata TaxID=453817 RepID=A0ABW0S3Q8_9BURK